MTKDDFNNKELIDVHLSPQQEAYTSSKNFFDSFIKYKRLVTGEESTAADFILFELVYTLFSNLPGMMGLVLRGKLYKALFNTFGKNIAFGKGITLRQPGKINLSSNIILDDYSTLEVRGIAGSIDISEHVVIGKFTSIVSKDAQIRLSKGVNISSHCRIATQSSVEIGKSTLVAAYSYIGPGNHVYTDSNMPIIKSGMDLRGGVKIGENCWIGAHSTIMDGVSIGDGAVVAAHSFVKDSVPAGVIVGGVPARVLYKNEG